MYMYSQQNDINHPNPESGFTLILAMVMLLLLSTIGIWALRTSTSELEVAGGAQQIEKQFNITEGAAYTEAAKVGFSLQSFYQISDPKNLNQLLIPTKDDDQAPLEDFDDRPFDPGGDTDTTLATLLDYKNNPAKGSPPANVWPWENLLRNYADNEFDYHYLTTYLYPDTAPMGYDANSFAGYKFRIQGAAARMPLVVELGGTKIGPK